MKRIRFISPIESISGNFSGRQNLKYAEHDNPAYDSPRGQRNYARNYRPSFIGGFVTKTGKAYFAVKTKTAVHMTAKAIKAMAMQGGVGALVGSLLAHKSNTPYTQAHAAWLAAVAAGDKRTLRKFLSDFVRAALLAKSENIVIAYSNIISTFKNPWFDGSMTSGASVSNEVLIKFWSQLAVDGIEFTVDGTKGIAKDGDKFEDLPAAAYNILGITVRSVDETAYVDCRGLWMQKPDGTYVEAKDAVDANVAYTLTATAPQA